MKMSSMCKSTFMLPESASARRNTPCDGTFICRFTPVRSTQNAYAPSFVGEVWEGWQVRCSINSNGPLSLLKVASHGRSSFREPYMGEMLNPFGNDTSNFSQLRGPRKIKQAMSMAVVLTKNAAMSSAKKDATSGARVFQPHICQRTS